MQAVIFKMFFSRVSYSPTEVSPGCLKITTSSECVEQLQKIQVPRLIFELLAVLSIYFVENITAQTQYYTIAGNHITEI